MYAHAIMTADGDRVAVFDSDGGSWHSTSWYASELSVGIAAGVEWRQAHPGVPFPPFASHSRGKRICDRNFDLLVASVYAAVDEVDEQVQQMRQLEEAVGRDATRRA